MYEYTAILYMIFIKIIVATRTTDDEFNSVAWLSASKDLENESDDLLDDLCEMMRSLGDDCGEEIADDMRTFFINTENVRKSAKLYDLFALNFLNKGIVGCLKNVVQAIVRLSMSTSSDGVQCVFKPLIDVVKVCLRLTLDSVTLVRHLHHETKECLTKRGLSKVTCLVALHARNITKIGRTLVELLKAVTTAVMYISGGFASTLVECAMSESSKAFTDMRGTAATFGKCILCAFTRRC